MPRTAPPGSGLDDVLDALACLWIAAASDDDLEPLPATDAPEFDGQGLHMEIWRRRGPNFRTLPALAGVGVEGLEG